MNIEVIYKGNIMHPEKGLFAMFTHTHVALNFSLF